MQRAFWGSNTVSVPHRLGSEQVGKLGVAVCFMECYHLICQNVSTKLGDASGVSRRALLLQIHLSGVTVPVLRS